MENPASIRCLEPEILKNGSDYRPAFTLRCTQVLSRLILLESGLDMFRNLRFERKQLAYKGLYLHQGEADSDKITGTNCV